MLFIIFLVVTLSSHISQIKKINFSADILIGIILKEMGAL